MSFISILVSLGSDLGTKLSLHQFCNFEPILRRRQGKAEKSPVHYPVFTVKAITVYMSVIGGEAQDRPRRSRAHADH
jgi:hypothetical protein